ncbi:hypothetical protein EHS13_21045 [Paenibacillus psychroresistens]|uniref:Uncharacterized protein n=1 Tax=Paenibacillus psychroresistens TaxID=1778678 RepID=A0A6B8RNB4_9BACL|nr:S-layer homology domain-containing protein [Paenibacillus psychroresistens]QGQ97192.1 hypothetical protein EHS13_21045 [Paenibacillus psychroresistens]
MMMNNPRQRLIFPALIVLGLLGFLFLFLQHTYAEIPVSLGKSVVASTVSGATYSAEKAVDGSIYTKWSAGSLTLPQSLTVDLGQNITVQRTETIFDDAASSYQYRIDSSLDGINWTSFVDKTSNVAASYPRYIDTGNVMARYMRITVSGVGTPGNFVVINQFDIFQSAAPLYLLSQGKTAAASSVFSASWDAGKAVDGLISSSWAPSSNNLPQWLVVDLGQNLNVLQAETTYTNKNEIYKYKIDFSVDGINWYPFSDQSTNSKLSNPRYIDLGNVTARYFRISTVGIGSVGAFPNIAEFNLYGPNDDGGSTPTPNPTISSITLNNSSYSINQGSTSPLVVTANNSDGSTTDVTSSATFSSSNPASVSISNSGVMTGVTLGNSTITASYHSLTATAAATVTSPLTITRLAFDYSTYSINTNAYRTITLNAYMTDGSYQNVTSSASYTTSSASVATINAYGSLYGNSAGSATITATYNGFSASSSVIVTSLINSISADISAFNVNVGSIHSMVITAHESNGTSTNVTTSASYSSSNSSMASVSSNGVTGVSPGSVTITVTYGGYTAYIYVTVENSSLPTWGANASIVPSGVTQTSVLLTWSGALDDLGVTGYRIYQNSNLLTTVSGVTSFTVDKLSAGQSYTFKVEAGDASQKWSITGPSVYVSTLALADLASPTPTPFSASTSSEIPLDISLVREDAEGGKLISKVRIEASALNKSINDASSNGNSLAAISFKLEDYKDTTVIEFPEKAFNDITTISPGLSVLIKFGTSSIRLPVSLLKKYAPPESGKLTFKIHSLTGDEEGKVKKLISPMKANQLLPSSLQFSLSANGVEIPSYEGIYVESTITITTDESLSLANATAVWINLKSGKTGFVPTTSTTDNNLTTFTLKVPYGGIFNLVSIEKHFTDLSQHWAKSDLELLASKLIINGVSNTVFAPDQEISRAQFAALLIRSLGLQSEGTVNAKSKFKDVKSSDWFAAEVQIASSKGLIDGYEDGSFKPLAAITREQMATMIYRAQKLVDHISNPANLDSALTKYTDQEKVGAWARTSLAATLQDGLIQGVTETNLAPQSNATRAQAGVMLKRLLQNIKFIN